jgi:hypothetical protein
MSRRHLGCVACRIRLHATAPEIELLEGMCPVCGARLKLASCVSDLMGCRLFDLSVLSDQESSEQANVLGRPVDLVARARDDKERCIGRPSTVVPLGGIKVCPDEPQVAVAKERISPRPTSSSRAMSSPRRTSRPLPTTTSRTHPAGALRVDAHLRATDHHATTDRAQPPTRHS